MEEVADDATEFGLRLIKGDLCGSKARYLLVGERLLGTGHPATVVSSYAKRRAPTGAEAAAPLPTRLPS
jgi:hypothetical protein